MLARLFLGQLYPGDRFEFDGRGYTVVSYDLKNMKVIASNGRRMEKFDRMTDVIVPDSELWYKRRLEYYHPYKGSLKK
ncbi:MAG: hypothetical protein HYW22_01765 [Candidatus Aenigmarchaeota archaeon]|nr:hypothetical protein [Candidatus Aenigmarchaeota archaeon]